MTTEELAICKLALLSVQAPAAVTKNGVADYRFCPG